MIKVQINRKGYGDIETNFRKQKLNNKMKNDHHSIIRNRGMPARPDLERRSPARD